mmetsp:Transcript_8018/g.21347  ORF Transcript_8018/g.21347 Transcript_8018/m.21347 type:complete len:453 (+) Transcript_8018:53-1411(+)
MVLDSFHLILRHAGFLDKAHHPVQNVEPAYEAITAELDRLAELAGTSRPRELPHLKCKGVPSRNPGLHPLHAVGAHPDHGSHSAVLPGPSGQAMLLSGLRKAGFLGEGRQPLRPSTAEPAYEAIEAELDRLAELGGSSRPREVHLGTLVPLSQFATVPESRPQEVEDGPEGSQPGDKLKRFKPLSILLPDSASTPAAPPGGSKGSGTPAGLGGGVQGAGASLTGAGQTSVQASTPGAGARAYMNGGVYLEGLALPSPAMSPLMYGQDGMDFSSFLLSARGPGNMSDLKGGSLWSPSSGSAGLGSLPRSGGHLGGFSDEAEGEDGGWVELEGNGGADNNAGLMVMGRSLSRAALVTHENQEREGGSSEVGATSLQQNQQVPPSQGVERQGQQQEQQQQGQGPHDQPAGGQQKGQGGEAVGPQHHHAAASSEQSGGMRPMEVDTPSGMEIPLDL